MQEDANDTKTVEISVVWPVPDISCNPLAQIIVDSKWYPYPEDTASPLGC